MKTANVVIGANFGDEGKGLITDFLSVSHNTNALVVRFNGGAQASHTVVTPEGIRHAFSHFGSGSFNGAATFLSRFFVCNPLLFVKEYHLLQSKSVDPIVYVDPAALVTTPYDMMINQIAEEIRGNSRHGSCGVGFGETIERDVHHRLRYGDLFNRLGLNQTLQKIRDDWLPQRLSALNIPVISEEWQDRILSDGILQKYLQDVDRFLQISQSASLSFLRDIKQEIIFEGAQGLLLDQDHQWFPHVTRSHTGLRNVMLLAEDAEISTLNVTYITRAYMTRHGAGPLPHELPEKPYPRIQDETNIPNAYQGALRFGWLDVDLLARTIQNDLSRNSSFIQLTHGLAVTCLDQVDDPITFINNGRIEKTSHTAFLDILKSRLDCQFMLTSHGPSRNHVARI